MVPPGGVSACLPQVPRPAVDGVRVTAAALGARRVPNRIDPWGPGWRHDWVTWRAMLPKYLDEFA